MSGSPFHPDRPSVPPAGSIHAIRAGIALLQLWFGARLFAAAAPVRWLLDSAFGSSNVDLALSALLALAGWRMFGPSVRERFPRARQVVALSWFLVPAALAFVNPAWSQILAASALLITALHVSTHTRRGSTARWPTYVDTAAAGYIALLGLAFQAFAALAWPPGEHGSFDGERWVFGPEGWWASVWVLASMLGAGAAMVWGLFRIATARATLDPGVLPHGWTVVPDSIAGARVRSTRTMWEIAFPAGDRTAILRVCRDPVPPWTEIVIPVPELAGLTARRRAPGQTGGLPLGNVLLDELLHVEGDVQRARPLMDVDGPWLELLHGWRGTIEDGAFVAIFEGDVPRPEWIGERTAGGTWTIPGRLIAGCQRAVASLTPPERAGAQVDARQALPRRVAE